MRQLTETDVERWRKVTWSEKKTGPRLLRSRVAAADAQYYVIRKQLISIQQADTGPLAHAPATGGALNASTDKHSAKKCRQLLYIPAHRLPTNYRR